MAKQIYIVNWDDPIMAPKKRDLMFIVGVVAKDSASTPNVPETWK